MKRLYWEILFGLIFVLGGTFIAYNLLSGIEGFWSAQQTWNLALIVCWIVVAFGYWRQGWIVHKSKSSTHVSILLPSTVFVVQCILFVKGIFYHDFALVTGALLVNSAVVFNLYQLLKFRNM